MNVPRKPQHTALSHRDTAGYRLVEHFIGDQPAVSITDLLIEIRHICEDRGIDYQLCEYHSLLQFVREKGRKAS